MKLNDFKDKVMQSIIEGRAFDLEGEWNVLGVLGDTTYHVFLFRDCTEKLHTINDELNAVCSEACSWFNGEGLTTMLPPCAPRQL